MARHKEPQDTLEELESLGERLASWSQERALLLGGIAALVLVAAAAVGATLAWQEGRSDDASAAVADLRREFVAAMGGSPNDVEIPEPANPETARQVREDYATRYAEAARQYAGTGAGALAALEGGSILLALDQSEDALALWRHGASAMSGNSTLRALLESRAARLLEDQDRFEEAAQAHEVAAGISSYAMRGLAYGDAARCWLAAGKVDEALRVYEQIERDFADLELPEYVRGRLEEARARAAGGDETS